jgi:hypothetical protein
MQLTRLETLLASGHRSTLLGGQFPNVNLPLRPVLSALIPTPLCGWYANYMEVLAHYGNKALGKAAPECLAPRRRENNA